MKFHPFRHGRGGFLTHHFGPDCPGHPKQQRAANSGLGNLGYDGRLS
jgi:hypothetical protein